MEKYKTVMTGLIAVALCLGLSWGGSPSMAFNQSSMKQQLPHRYKENRFPRSWTFKPFNSGISKNFNNQSFNSQPKHRPYKENRFPRSWTFKPFNSGISNMTTKSPRFLSPGYGKNVVGAVDSNKVRHTDAGAGKRIDIGQPFGTFNPTLQNHSKAWQAMQAAKAKAQQDAWNKSGGYGGNGGNGVLPPGPAQVPGSTPPPQANSGPPLCVPDILSGGCMQLDSLHTNAGAGKRIDIGKPFGTFNPTLQNHSKAWQAMQAAKAKQAQQAMINKIGTPFGTRPQWNRHAGHGGGYGEGGGHAGNGVLPPPNPVPVSTAPTPPPAQSTQPPQVTCNPAVDICVH